MTHSAKTSRLNALARYHRTAHAVTLVPALGGVYDLPRSQYHDATDDMDGGIF